MIWLSYIRLFTSINTILILTIIFCSSSFKSTRGASYKIYIEKVATQILGNIHLFLEQQNIGIIVKILQRTLCQLMASKTMLIKNCAIWCMILMNEWLSMNSVKKSENVWYKLNSS